MTPELHCLVYSIILGLVQLLAAAHFNSWQYGYGWTAGNREEPMPPLTGVAGRVDRAWTNFMETFPFFAAVVLIAHLAGRHNGLTLWGAWLYFGGRVLHAIASIAGYSWLRSVIWNVALGGIILFIIALF